MVWWQRQWRQTQRTARSGSVKTRRLRDSLPEHIAGFMHVDGRRAEEIGTCTNVGKTFPIARRFESVWPGLGTARAAQGDVIDVRLRAATFVNALRSSQARESNFPYSHHSALQFALSGQIRPLRRDIKCHLSSSPCYSNICTFIITLNPSSMTPQPSTGEKSSDPKHARNTSKHGGNRTSTRLRNDSARQAGKTRRNP